MKDDKIKEIRIKEALEILRLNDFNYTKTAKETGFHRQTLKRWSLDMRKPTNLPELLTDPEEKEILVDKAKFGQKTFQLKELILTKMVSVLDKCRDLDTLARALKIVQEVELANEGHGDLPNILNNTQNFIQIINNQYKLKHDSDEQER